MKKFLAAVLISLTAVVSVFAQDAGKTQITFSTEQGKDVKLYVKGATDFGKGDFLCDAPATVEVPTGDLIFFVNKMSNMTIVNYTTTGKPVSLKVEEGNPGLATLGYVIESVGCIAIGAGIGLVMVSYMNNDTKSMALFAGGVALPGVAITAGGIVLKKMNMPKLIEVKVE